MTGSVVDVAKGDEYGSVDITIESEGEDSVGRPTVTVMLAEGVSIVEGSAESVGVSVGITEKGSVSVGNGSKILPGRETTGVVKGGGGGNPDMAVS